MMQDSLTGFATEMGLKVVRLLPEDEVNQRCGLREGRKLPAAQTARRRFGERDTEWALTHNDMRRRGG